MSKRFDAEKTIHIQHPTVIWYILVSSTVEIHYVAQDLTRSMQSYRMFCPYQGNNENTMSRFKDIVLAENRRVYPDSSASSKTPCTADKMFQGVLPGIVNTVGPFAYQLFDAEKTIHIQHAIVIWYILVSRTLEIHHLVPDLTRCIQIYRMFCPYHRNSENTMFHFKLIVYPYPGSGVFVYQDIWHVFCRKKESNLAQLQDLCKT